MTKFQIVLSILYLFFSSLFYLNEIEIDYFVIMKNTFTWSPDYVLITPYCKLHLGAFVVHHWNTTWRLGTDNALKEYIFTERIFYLSFQRQPEKFAMKAYAFHDVSITFLDCALKFLRTRCRFLLSFAKLLSTFWEIKQQKLSWNAFIKYDVVDVLISKLWEGHTKNIILGHLKGLLSNC